MMPLLSFAIAIAAFPAAAALTGVFVRYASERALLDIPNARSSHVVPTPRGGGMAIVVTTVAALVVAALAGALTSRDAAGLAGAGTLVALIGFADDHVRIPAGWRLLGHFVAAAWLVWWIGAIPPLRLAGWSANPGWGLVLVAVVYVVWMLNLTNFMDGIDGIAAVEAITVSLGGAVLYVSRAPATTQLLPLVVLASATLGFLVWNWPPARIFLGDSGSGFLGIMLAGFSLLAARVSEPLFWGWLILAGVFIVDATVTLIRRFIRRERVHEAHRSHAYQHAAVRLRSHKRVTLAVAAINIVWLLPIAWLTAAGPLPGLAGLSIAYAPLAIIALWLGAGRPSRS